ncbi:g8524 [Coccomyxa viridis]|uniref:G8524 protein n=1 Tax=Coccomyxa viridis TaxID=1274662 RepID=A0ABP1G345_9CHLO
MLVQRKVLKGADTVNSTEVSGSIDDEHAVNRNLNSLSNLSDLFHKADINGDGVIDRDELKILLQSTNHGAETISKHPSWISEEEVTTWLSKYDWDKSGDISFAEFAALVRGGALLDGKLEEYEAAWQAAGGEDISTQALGDLFKKLGQPLDAYRLSTIEARLSLAKTGGKITFPHFLEMFRADLLDLKEIMRFLQMGSSAPTSETATVPELKSGEVNFIWSEEEFDWVLSEHAQQLIVLEASLTWCRPCKGFERAFQKFASAYAKTVFLKFYGNHSEGTKHLFETRLQTPMTPTFTFWRQGKQLHEHHGANKVKMDAALQSLLEPDENPLTGANAFKKQVFQAKVGLS